MKPDHELLKWLSSPSRQARTMDRVAGYRRALRETPSLDRLDSALAEAGTCPDSVLAAARTFLASGEPTEDLVSSMIAEARTDPYFRPPVRNASTELLSGLWIYDRPLLGLFLAVVSADALASKRAAREGRASIAFTGQRSLYKILRSGGARLSIWEVPEIGASFSGGSAVRCSRTAELALHDGDLIEIDGRRQGFVIEETSSDLVYVQAYTPLGAAPLMAEYDADSLEFVGASSTDEASSRIQMMLSLLRLMDRGDAAPLFEELIRQPHFYARWQAMREFLALDGERALPHLRSMASGDPHHEVREAASATLAALDVEEPEMAEGSPLCLA
jgi:hypothetical protein